MISQRCPKCLSNRVRRGYRPTPFWLKIFFRYNLLCDNCNWEFTGFAVPGTVSAKPTRSPKKKPIANNIEESNLNSNKFVQTPRNETSEVLIETENPSVEEIIADKQVAAEENDAAVGKGLTEDLSAAEKSTESRVGKKTKGSNNKAKRKSGV